MGTKSPGRLSVYPIRLAKNDESQHPD